MSAAAAIAYSGAAPMRAPARQAVNMAALDSMVGASTEMPFNSGKAWDPMGFALLGDLPTQESRPSNNPSLKWLREAELKHGRIAMLAVVGYAAVDQGLVFPGAQFAGVSSLDAHDLMVKAGIMQQLFFAVAFFEVLDAFRLLTARQDGSWPADYTPGDFQLDPFKMANDKYRLAEIKNGRLAMFAISGILTQSALTGHGFPYTA